MEKGHGFRNFITSTFGRIMMTVILMIIIYGAMLLCINSNVPWLAIPIGVACLVFGWKKLGETPWFIQLFASANFLMFHYIIKLLLSILIGYVVAPFQISKMIANHISSLGENAVEEHV